MQALSLMIGNTPEIQAAAFARRAVAPPVPEGPEGGFCPIQPHRFPYGGNPEASPEAQKTLLVAKKTKKAPKSTGKRSGAASPVGPEPAAGTAAGPGQPEGEFFDSFEPRPSPRGLQPPPPQAAQGNGEKTPC